MAPRFTVLLRTPAGETRLTVDADTDVLSAALEAGLDLPYLCRQGWCTTCAARLISGDVDQSEARRYFPADREAGYILLCSACPRSDLVVETHQKLAMRRHRQAHGLPAPRG